MRTTGDYARLFHRLLWMAFGFLLILNWFMARGANQEPGALSLAGGVTIFALALMWPWRRE